MRTFTIKLIAIIFAFSSFQNIVYAQVINWNNISKKNRHFLCANTGLEYGLTAGLGYHHLIPVKNFPLWIGGEFSAPAGNHIADDFKVRVGTQIRIAAFNHLHFSARVEGISRRYQNQSVTLFNFGSDFAGTFGFYRTHWFLSVEVGFDKAIVTHFRHSDWYKNNIYDNVQDGWYEPASGGNFYYGLQGGYFRRGIDFTLKAGKLFQQDFKAQPLFPFYGQLGVNFRF